MKAIINGKLITPAGIIENKVLVFDTKIEAITDTVPQGCEVIDAKHQYVSPGLIDVHIHGSCGCDTMDQSVASIEAISSGIAQNGVTSFLPTTMTMNQDAIYGALETVRICMNQTLKGAKVLGAHMEGPFINVAYKGAQPAESIIKPSYEFIKSFTDVLKIVTFAPELDEQLAFAKEVKANTKITLSMGHTNATFDEAMNAIEAGVSHVTHLFNAMTPLNHREPGVVGAALSSDVFTEVIADNIHINPGLFPFVVQNKGLDKVILITDCMRAGCMKDGKYDLGGQDVFVEGGAARLASGNLAGSVLTLNKAIANFVNSTKLPLEQVIQMAALNPATSIGVQDTKGSLEVGKDADIAIFDADMNCQLTISEGRIIFSQ